METEDDVLNMEEVHNNFIIGKWQWLMGYLHPEVFSPGRLPQTTAYPTHTFTSKFNDVVNVWKSRGTYGTTEVEHPELQGKFWLYFSPVADLLSLTNKLSEGKTPAITLDTTYYATSNGPRRRTDSKALYAIDIGPQNLNRKFAGSFTGYKKLRVNSASLVITPSGPLKSQSGIIKVGYSFRRCDSHFKQIDFDRFENYFQSCKIYQLKNDHQIICRFRPTKDLLDDFAPYHPLIDIPYFVVYGEGISPEVTFNVSVIRHFEGVAMQQYSQLFYSTWEMDQIELYIQKLAAASVKDPDIISSETRDSQPENLQKTIEKIATIFDGIWQKVYNHEILASNHKLLQEGMYHLTRKVTDSILPPHLKAAADKILPYYNTKLGLKENIKNLAGKYGDDVLQAAFNVIK